MSSSSSTPAAAPPPPPLPPLPPLPPAPEVVAAAAKKSILRRVFPLLVIANVVVGVYVFTRASKKQPSEKVPSAPEPVVTKEATVPEKAPTETTPVLKVLPPVPEHDQRELFKWILEEKRKVKPRDKLEKKKLNEEKALLKEFIRSESIPSL